MESLLQRKVSSTKTGRGNPPAHNKNIMEKILTTIIAIVLGLCVALGLALNRSNALLEAQNGLIEKQKEYIQSLEELSDVQEEIINNTTKRYDRINPNSTSIR